MKSYLRRDNQACSSSIRWNQKTERGTKKKQMRKAKHKETQCKKREAEAGYSIGADNYCQRQDGLGQCFQQMFPEEETDRGRNVFYV